jgi:hypothetical protein
MEREKRKLRERFNKNGGQLLKSIKIEIFTKEKLDHMTNNYSCIIGRGAFGQVYKGTTGTGTGTGEACIAVKRSIAINEERQKDFANEITIQSKISHRNLVNFWAAAWRQTFLCWSTSSCRGAASTTCST